MFIGRADGTPNAIKFLGVGFHKDSQKIEIDTGTVTKAYSRIGKNRYLSALVKHNERSDYLILKYDFPDDQTVRFALLKSEPVAKAIAEGKIRGLIGVKNKTSPWILDAPRQAVYAFRPWEDPRMEDVELTDTPDAIVQFLDDHERECFASDDFVVLKRSR